MFFSLQFHTHECINIYCTVSSLFVSCSYSDITNGARNDFESRPFDIISRKYCSVSQIALEFISNRDRLIVFREIIIVMSKMTPEQFINPGR